MRRASHARTLVSAAIVISAAWSCIDTTAPQRVPARVEIVSGQLQSGTVGEPLGAQIVVRVLDAADNPVSGQPVDFQVLGGHGSVVPVGPVTDIVGVAAARWTLGTVATDSQVVEARAIDRETRMGLASATFRATARAGPPAAVAAVLGATQSAAPRTPMPDSLMVRVVDRYANPVADVRVDWAIPLGAGTLSRAVDTTSADGYARTLWTTGTGPGTYVATATVSGLSPVSFNGTVTVGAASRLVVKALSQLDFALGGA